MHSASYASVVYQPRRYKDTYGSPRYDGKKVRGELDQTVLEHTVRNISYRIPKSRQPCDGAPKSEVKLTWWSGKMQSKMVAG
ncbi:jg27449 [Pararge aegeria aegeria]|uniref:Jg27449 protein n=1 Tax=Pararge aegeria aegeria TaxID=348720 RepID=A0A8S4R1N1_9NEOP|nr:jg27449 [Pararge aegeria aegeria]